MAKSLLLTAALVMASGTASAHIPVPTDIRLSANTATVARAAATADDIMTEQPAGTLIDPAYGASEHTWLISSGMVGTYRNSGYATAIVRTDDAVYVRNMITELNVPDYWVKGDIHDDGTVVFSFPQHIYHSDASGTTAAVDYYIGQLTPTLSGTSVSLVAIEGQTNLTMKFDGDRLVQVMPEITGALAPYAGVVGAYTKGGGFRGYGESGISYRLSPLQLAVPPTSLETKPYVFEYTDGANAQQKRTVQIGVDGNDLWIQGVNQFVSTSWIKGSIENGKVTFGSTYTGAYEGFLTYVTGLNADASALVTPFTITADGNDYVADQTLFVNIGDEYPELNDVRIFKNARFVLQEISGSITPSDPMIDSSDEGIEYDESEGLLAVCFMMDATDSEGNTLDSNKLFYNILLDGKVYEFDASLYDRTMTEVPYNYGCDLIYNLDGYLMVFIFEKPETVGVRAIYRDGDYVSYSATDTYNFKEGGVDAIIADSPVVDSVLYTIDGRRVSNTEAGNMYIRLDRRANGTATAVKFVAR